jgi:Domain of unknown function (DUF1841)
MSVFAHEDRTSLRARYFDAWAKQRAGRPLEPLEVQITDVVSDHPEYHAALADETTRDADFTAEAGRTNPFLHLGLHLAVRDQIATDRPTGIRAAFWRILEQAPDMHTAEHMLLECLAETLWEAQRQGSPPDERVYLERVLRIGARGGQSRMR